jgi:hypothetical protein
MRGETRVGPGTSGGPAGGWSTMVDAGEAEGANSREISGGSWALFY